MMLILDTRSNFRSAALLLLACAAVAIASPVATHRTANAVMLRWRAPRVADLDRCNVYRRDSEGGAWKLLTPNGVRRMTSEREITQTLGTRAKQFFAAFKLKSSGDLGAEEFSTFLADSENVKLLDLMSVSVPEYANVMGELFADSTISAGTQVAYCITALRGANENEIGITNTMAAGVPDTLASPAGVAGEDKIDHALIAWPFPKTKNIVGYDVYRATTIIGPYTQINVTKILPVVMTVNKSTNTRVEFSDIDVRQGSTYFYEVRASDLFAMQSAPSAAVAVTIGASSVPEVPHGVRAEVFGRAARIFWDTLPAGITGVEIFRAIGREKFFPMLSGTVMRGTRWIDRTVHAGGVYRYCLRAVNASRKESAVSDTVIVALPDREPPAAPRGLKAVADKTGFNLKWNANTEEDLDGYMLERATSAKGNDFLTLNGAPIRKTEFHDAMDARSQRIFTYRVIAVDRIGNASKPSDTVRIRMPDVVAPDAPIFSRVNCDGGSVHLAWDAPRDGDVAKYRVYRGKSDKDLKRIAEIFVRQYRDSLAGVGAHRYCVTAVDSAGNESDRANATTLTCAAPTPSARDGKAEQEGTRVTLHWTPAGGSAARVLISRIDLATKKMHELIELPAGAKTYIDKHLTPNAAYEYHITTYDAAWKASAPLIIIPAKK